MIEISDRISQKGLRHYVDVIVVEGLITAVAAAAVATTQILERFVYLTEYDGDLNTGERAAPCNTCIRICIASLRSSLINHSRESPSIVFKCVR